MGGLFSTITVFFFIFHSYEVMEIRRIDVVAFELCWGENFSLHNYTNNEIEIVENSCCAMSLNIHFLNKLGMFIFYSLYFSYSKFQPLNKQLKFQWLQWEKTRWILFLLIFICYAINKNKSKKKTHKYSECSNNDKNLFN